MDWRGKLVWILSIVYIFTRIDGFLLHMWRRYSLPTRCTEVGLRSQSQNEGLLTKGHQTLNILTRCSVRSTQGHAHFCVFLVSQWYGLSWQKSDDAVFTCSWMHKVLLPTATNTTSEYSWNHLCQISFWETPRILGTTVDGKNPAPNFW